MSAPVLEVSDLTKRYGARTVVDGVSFSVSRGEVFGLLGPNGAGKTTTFKMIMGILHPDGGDVLLNGASVGRFPMFMRAKAGFGYLAQEPAVFASFTVKDNIIALLEARGTPLPEARERTAVLLEEFRLTYLADNKAGRLSGGERRRLEIARTLSFDPKVLLLDEPFTGIDPKSIEEIKDIIAKLKKKDLGILLTDHNVRDTFSITDRACIIESGNVIASGAPKELCENPKVRETYLGDKFTM
ncbi:MAG: LPS export ABC transporter ATP-binding protein [Candidatus Brocadiia bacterium]